RRQGADQLVLRRGPGVRHPAGQPPPVRLGHLAARLRGQGPAPALPGQLPPRLRREALAAVGRPDLRPPLRVLGFCPGFLHPPARPAAPPPGGPAPPLLGPPPSPSRPGPAHPRPPPPKTPRGWPPPRRTASASPPVMIRKRAPARGLRLPRGQGMRPADRPQT